jgi:peptidoglycan/xylan/chitin deacetylase (PgdA/CDA1 family)
MIAPRTTAEVAAAAVVLAAASAALVHAAYSPGSQLFGRTLVAGRDPNEVALTYDDGPNEAVTLALLDELARHNARATFFMIGQWARSRPEIVRAVHAAGHLVGNHTMTHPWLTWKPAAVVREELRACNAALEDALGAPVRYFRAPHGARRPAVLRIVNELGLVPVQWNAMGLDWTPIGAEQMLANVVKGVRRNQERRRGSNILLHDGSQHGLGTDRRAIIEVTARLLERFAGERRRIVTVDAWG